MDLQTAKEYAKKKMDNSFEETLAIVYETKLGYFFKVVPANQDVELFGSRQYNIIAYKYNTTGWIHK